MTGSGHKKDFNCLCDYLRGSVQTRVGRRPLMLKRRFRSIERIAPVSFGDAGPNKWEILISCLKLGVSSNDERV